MFRLLNLSQEPNPVGEVHHVDAVEEQLIALAAQWDEQLEEQVWRWYYYAMPWKWGRKVNLFQVTDFLLKSLDGLIAMIDDKVDLGPDKKATVLNAIDRLYEYVIKEALPIWLKPIAGKVKNYIIFTLVSVAIDWIVDKYHNGEWRDAITEEDDQPAAE